VHLNIINKFAVFQYNLSLSVEPSDDFSPEMYSLGYGCHVAADGVGHHGNGFVHVLFLINPLYLVYICLSNPNKW
jgi:hypothetical protein